jgi:hypothetical protein
MYREGDGKASMKRIILFRFHKNPTICRNRIRLLKKLNPDTQIFGLFGGEEKDYKEFQKKLRPYLKNIYCIQEKTKLWKWKNCDLALRLWYKEFGNKLSFDMIHVIEWDLLLYDSLDKLYKNVPKDGMGLTKLILLEDIKERWFWFNNERKQYKIDWDSSLRFVKNEFNYNQEPYACNIGGACMPKKFLEKYCAMEIPELLQTSIHDELRLPLFGQILGFKLYDTGLSYRWFSENEYKFFNAQKNEISMSVITKELANPFGRRVFHPIEKIIVYDFASYLTNLLIQIKEYLKSFAEKVFRLFRKILKLL